MPWEGDNTVITSEEAYKAGAQAFLDVTDYLTTPDLYSLLDFISKPSISALIPFGLVGQIIQLRAFVDDLQTFLDVLHFEVERRSLPQNSKRTSILERHRTRIPK